MGSARCVLERAPAFGEVGVGLQVAPNALSVLDVLGVGTAAEKYALPDRAPSDALRRHRRGSRQRAAGRALRQHASATPTRCRIAPTSTVHCSTPAALDELIELRTDSPVVDFPRCADNGVVVTTAAAADRRIVLPR